MARSFLLSAAVLAAAATALAGCGGSSTASTSPQTGASTAASGGSSADPVCKAASQTDPAYSLQLQTTPNPPTAAGTLFSLAISRDGKPVTGAKVCLAADMSTMPSMEIASSAAEKSAGNYQLQLKLPMRGPWEGNAIVVQPGQPAVRVPVSFNAG